MSPDPLAGLRDIHLPAPVAFWPPAPGWWVLAGIGTIAVALAAWWAYRTRRGRAARKAALAELRALREASVAAHTEVFAAAVSQLLRRYALVCFPHRQVAGLTGDAWLSFLDATGGAGEFCSGPGRILASAAYGKREPVDTGALLALTERWIRQAAKHDPRRRERRNRTPDA